MLRDLGAEVDEMVVGVGELVTDFRERGLKGLDARLDLRERHRVRSDLGDHQHHHRDRDSCRSESGPGPHGPSAQRPRLGCARVVGAGYWAVRLPKDEWGVKSRWQVA